MPSEIIQGRVEDFRFTPIFETEEVEFTYLPTGFSTRMNLEQLHQFIVDTAAVLEQLRGSPRLDSYQRAELERAIQAINRRKSGDGS